MTDSTLDALLADFDAAELDFKKIAHASGIIEDVEAALAVFLETIWPKISPYVDVAIDFVAIAAGAATGPLAPLVTYVAEAFGHVGLNYLVRWLVGKLQPKKPT